MAPRTRTVCVFLFFFQLLAQNVLPAGGASHWYLNERLGLIQRVTDVSPPLVYGKFRPRRNNEDEGMAIDEEEKEAPRPVGECGYQTEPASNSKSRKRPNRTGHHMTPEDSFPPPDRGMGLTQCQMCEPHSRAGVSQPHFNSLHPGSYAGGEGRRLGDWKGINLLVSQQATEYVFQRGAGLVGGGNGVGGIVDLGTQWQGARSAPAIGVDGNIGGHHSVCGDDTWQHPQMQEVALIGLFKKYGGIDAAIDQLEKSLSSEDQAPEVWNDLGLAYRASGQLERSLECLERAGAVMLHPDGCVNVGTTHFLLGNLNDAEFAFRQGLHLDPHHPLLHFCLAGVQQAVGRKDEAMRHLEEALSLQPEFIAAQIHLMELRRGREEWGLSLSWWFALAVFTLLCFVAQQSVRWCVMETQLGAKPQIHHRQQPNPLPPHPVSPPGRKKKRST